ncbi:hypothetical protein FDI40_gp657 [Agrobacterium phage Atu_ph07]|uniref:Uncharacterized protein n=1 Tax=Agrobacterium phage Atu_ph07 TaxID=2024264 RepID=A0A2L0V0X8_9CAUD|nr:hypothetical protein FDI40_gp657 [Agrobacterium phage Atu_ph07]AUZ95416.1 hypothetical protein [Agrobacterium phage Atu_ph07]
MFAIKIEKLWFKGVSPTVYVDKDKTDDLINNLEHIKRLRASLKKSRKKPLTLSHYDRRIKQLNDDIEEEKKRKKKVVDFSKPIHEFVEDVSEAKLFSTKKSAETVYKHLIKVYGKISKNIKIVDVTNL